MQPTIRSRSVHSSRPDGWLTSCTTCRVPDHVCPVPPEVGGGWAAGFVTSLGLPPRRSSILDVDGDINLGKDLRTVAHEQHRRTMIHPPNVVDDSTDRPPVEMVGWFIEYEQRGSVDERPRYRYPLALPTREEDAVLADGRFQTIGQIFHEGFRLSQAERRLHFGKGDSLAAVEDVLQNGARAQKWLLGNDSHLSTKHREVEDVIGNALCRTHHPHRGDRTPR